MNAQFPRSRFVIHSGFTLIELRKGFSIFESRFSIGRYCARAMRHQWFDYSFRAKRHACQIENPKSKTHHAPRGFTLIELLTVIAIIGILACIMIPVISKVRESAANSQCRSALRHYGVAIQMYINDNKDKFPGPCYGFVKRHQLAEGSNHLFSYLAPYVSLQNIAGASLPDNYLCLGLLRKAVDPRKNTLAVFKISNQVQVGPNASNKDIPCGYPGSSRPPYTYSTVASYNVLSRAWLITDVDQVNGSLDASASSLPLKPVHGNHRNILYLDWHVGPAPIEDTNI